MTYLETWSVDSKNKIEENGIMVRFHCFTGKPPVSTPGSFHCDKLEVLKGIWRTKNLKIDKAAYRLGL